MMPKFELPMEHVAAAGRTNITTTDSARAALHVDPREAYGLNVEISKLAAKLRVVRPYSWTAEQITAAPAWEEGCRAGLAA